MDLPTSVLMKMKTRNAADAADAAEPPYGTSREQAVQYSAFGLAFRRVRRVRRVERFFRLHASSGAHEQVNV